MRGFYGWLLALATLPVQADCLGSSELDSCLVGTWRQTAGGPEEWLRTQLPPGVPTPTVAVRNQVVSLRGDGTFVSAPVSVQSSMSLDEGRAQGDSAMQVQASGRWSVAGGVLNFCPDVQNMNGQTRVTQADGSSYNQSLGPAAPLQNISQRYRCAADRLETEMSFPGNPQPMTTTYSR